jgi:pimeloyl-ACP methyl ester carboxylesterase
MKNQKNKRNLNLLALVFCLVPFISNCAYLNITNKDDIIGIPTLNKGSQTITSYNSAVIKGKIISTDELKNPVLLIAYPLSPENSPSTDYLILNSSSSFMLYLPEGSYHLYAISDINNDGIFTEGEVSGVYGLPQSPQKVSLSRGDVVENIVIRSSKENAGKVTFPQQLRIKENHDTISQMTYNGQISKIYDEKFSRENAAAGWWNPTAFMKAFGAQIYFLEEYDPHKIPVLFVHGAEGSPQNWIYFLIRLDRNRYQPWFFYYPSGIHLSLAAQLLYDDLIELQNKYKFTKMGIAAHSIGGLTTRSLLTRYKLDRQNNFVRLFVTFATPWTGFEVADLSQVMVHKSIPSWMDLGSQSVFIRRTMNAELPAQIKYYLFYGKEDKLSKGKALDDRAMLNAREKFGFDCDHNTILTDRKVFIKFNEILEKELFLSN